MLVKQGRWILVLALVATWWGPPVHAGEREDAAAVFAAKRWKEAASAYQKLATAAPDDGFLWWQLASARHALGEYQQAIPAWKRAVELGFRPFLSWYNLACSHARAGQREEALDALDKALQQGTLEPKLIEGDEDLASLKSAPRFGELLQKASRKAHPCHHASEHRAFDFWIGEWEVSTAHGERAGESRVELILDKCVLLENWTSRFGTAGKSFNSWDRESDRWVQTWVDSRGELTVYRGGRQGEAMQLTTDPFTDDGKRVMKRMTFTPLADGRVRQHGEKSTDDGKTWATEFDLYYSRAAR